jgi:hypothetical protein
LLKVIVRVKLEYVNSEAHRRCLVNGYFLALTTSSIGQLCTIWGNVCGSAAMLLLSLRSVFAIKGGPVTGASPVLGLTHAIPITNDHKPNDL